MHLIAKTTIPELPETRRHWANNGRKGTAIDLTFDGEVDTRGDGKCQAWLLLVYGFFHAEGWFWGTSFPTEDSMHFELADETVAKLSI